MPERASSRRRARGDRQHRGEREHVVVLSSMRAGEDEDDPSLVDISRRGMVGWARPRCWDAWQAAAGLRRLVSQVRFSPLFYFPFFEKIFSI
jgi:hypothetical protein